MFYFRDMLLLDAAQTGGYQLSDDATGLADLLSIVAWAQSHSEGRYEISMDAHPDEVIQWAPLASGPVLAILKLPTLILIGLLSR